jgi:hypothetical protein
MHDLNLFSAIRDSQDGKTLASWTQRNQSTLDDLQWDFTDALNALLVLSYRAARSADDVTSDLTYVKGQVTAALKAVQGEVQS